MIALGSLWLSVLIAAVLVFAVSSLVWMVLPHHKKDFRGLPDEDRVLAALGEDLAPGQYDFPHLASPDEIKRPDVQERFERWPAGFFIVAPRGVPNMGRNLGIWMVYCLAVSYMVAYVLSRTLPPGTEYLRVFQIGGTVAWLAYGFAVLQDSIWFHRPWSFSLKHLFDAFLYAMVTAGSFAGFWPS